MTNAQRRLLNRARASAPEPLVVRGSDLLMAERLAAAGHVRLRVGGSGVPFKGEWWYEIIPSGTAW